MRKTGFWTSLGGALGELVEVEETDASFTASAGTGFGVSAMVQTWRALNAFGPSCLIHQLFLDRPALNAKGTLLVPHIIA